jgi:hypothetical protein
MHVLGTGRIFDSKSNLLFNDLRRNANCIMKVCAIAFGSHVGPMVHLGIDLGTYCSTSGSCINREPSLQCLNSTAGMRMPDPGGRTSGREPGKVLCLLHSSEVDYTSARPMDLQPAW